MELKNFLFPLIELTYKYENFDELVIPDEPVYHSKCTTLFKSSMMMFPC